MSPLLNELIVVTAVLAGGCAAARAAGVRGWVLPAFGLLAGVSVLVVVGLVQVVTPLPDSPALAVAVTVAGPALWWWVRWRRGHAAPVSLSLAGLARAGLVLAGLAGAVVLLRLANLAKWHTDSFTYLMAGSLIADGRYAEDVSTHMLTKRSLALPVLHAPAQLAGDYYLHSIHALLAAATLAVVIWYFRRFFDPVGGPAGTAGPGGGSAGTAGPAGRVGPALLAGFTVLGALLLVSNNRFVFSAFYLNGHLLTAALLVIVVGSGWLLHTRRPDPDPHPDPTPGGGLGGGPVGALMAMQVLVIPALVAARPETPVLAALALLPTWLSGRIPLRHRMVTMATFGVATVLWQAFGVWVHAQRGAEVPLEVSGSLALGGAAILAVPLLRWRRLSPRAGALLWTVEVGLWLAVLAFALRDSGILRASVTATEQNIVGGRGYWGLSLVVLGLLFGVAVLLRTPDLGHLRFPITTFAPLALLLAYLRDEPYRVGYGDSLSRMLMHIVPLVVLYVVAAMTGYVASAPTAAAPRAAEAGPEAEPAPEAELAAQPGPEARSEPGPEPVGEPPPAAYSGRD